MRPKRKRTPNGGFEITYFKTAVFLRLTRRKKEVKPCLSILSAPLIYQKKPSPSKGEVT